jgi:DNA-binding transcriptional LysR family regulator
MLPNDPILRRIKLSDLRLLQAVVEHGSMAKAAAHLSISQPAISKAMAALEATLGVKLLDRSSSGVELTVYGRALLQGGTAAFDELAKGISRIRHLSDPGIGELRIGCTEAGAAAFVPAVINRLAASYPRIVFRVETADPMTLVERDLPQRRVEIAIGALPDLPRGGEVEATVLYDDRQFVMAGEDNKWARRRRIKLADLTDEPWILPPPESIVGVHIAELFRSHGLRPPTAQVVSFSIPLRHTLLAAGRFLTMHPAIMLSLSKHVPLKRLDVEFAGVARAVGILTLKNRTLSPLAQLFVDTARKLAVPLSRGQTA